MYDNVASTSLWLLSTFLFQAVLIHMAVDITTHVRALNKTQTVTYLSNKKRFTPIHAANLKIIREHHQPAWNFPNGWPFLLINQLDNEWPTPFSPISEPPAFGELYSMKYFRGFTYCISHGIKDQLKNMVTLVGLHSSSQPHVCLCLSLFFCRSLFVPTWLHWLVLVLRSEEHTSELQSPC